MTWYATDRREYLARRAETRVCAGVRVSPRGLKDDGWPWRGSRRPSRAQLAKNVVQLVSLNLVVVKSVTTEGTDAEDVPAPLVQLTGLQHCLILVLCGSSKRLVSFFEDDVPTHAPTCRRFPKIYRR